MEPDQVALASFLIPAEASFSATCLHMGSCQNYGPVLGTLNIRCRNMIRTQKGTIILTTTHMTAC